MLSDEEKKAIEKIRSFNQYNWEMNNLKEKEFAKPYFDALDTILNLIKKQSKEIEELKEKNKQVKFLYDDACKCLLNTIDKDKIKAKIEELKLIADNGANAVRFAMTHDDEVERIQKQKDISAMIDILQSLLEKE